MDTDALCSAAIVRKTGHILLVREQDENGQDMGWGVPIGIAGPGELAIETLVRVVREQTNLEIIRVRRLVSVTQTDMSPHPSMAIRGAESTGHRSTTLLFEVAEWRGTLPDWHFIDPAGEARFWTVSEAIELLERHSMPSRSGPILAHLQDTKGESAWIYRRDPEGKEALTWPPAAIPPEMEERVRRARAFMALGCLVILAIFIIIVIIGLITLVRPFA